MQHAQSASRKDGSRFFHLGASTSLCRASLVCLIDSFVQGLSVVEKSGERVSSENDLVIGNFKSDFKI